MEVGGRGPLAAVKLEVLGFGFGFGLRGGVVALLEAGDEVVLVAGVREVAGDELVGELVLGPLLVRRDCVVRHGCLLGDVVSGKG